MGENDAELKNMAAQLAAMLRVQGEKGREAWSQLHGKLAEVAAMAGNDPRTAVQALLEVAKDAWPSQALEERVSKVAQIPGLLKSLVLLVADELNMSPLGDSGEPVHMVDEDSNFCEANVDRIIKRSAELSAPNTPYAVVSIVGAQSSGFLRWMPNMDDKPKSQTTRGIMMSRCIGPSLLVLDIEGFDGRENGKDTSFEKQAALFALTVSDLMIVNMHIFDIGREQGGGIILFRTIFQERTKIERAGLTKLLVVLRSYNGETSLEILRGDVQQRLQKIWESVNMKSMKFKHYIEVDIFGMPDKESLKFPKEVTVLRRVLSKNRSAKVPASSFTASSKIVWENVMQNRNLDIPSHQVLIASLYCRRLVEHTLNSLDSLGDYMHLKAEVLKDEPSPSRYRKLSDALLERIRNGYDLETKMYDPDIRDKERQFMLEKIYKIFTDYAREIILKTKETTSKQYKGEFDRDIQNNEKGANQYGKMTENKCLYEFTNSCKDLKEFDPVYLQSIHGQLKDHIEAHIARQILKIKEERDRIAYEKRNRHCLRKLFSYMAGYD